MKRGIIIKRLLDILEKRALLFLKALYIENDWLTEKELSLIGECSSGATYRTITFLKEFFNLNETPMEIVSQQSKGFILNSSTNLSLKEVEANFFKETLTFKILDNIFQNQPDSISSLANDLFFSTSTTYRKIKQIANYLADNNLHLDMKTLSVSGPEYLIREFFFRFYWDVLFGTEWAFNNYTFQEALQSLEHKMDHSLLNLNNIEKIQFIYRLAVNDIRHSQGYFLTEIEPLFFISPQLELYVKELSTLVSDKNWPATIRHNEATYLALLLLDNPIFEEQVIDYGDAISWYKKNQLKAYYFSEQLLNALLDEAHYITIKNEKKLFYKFCVLYIHVAIFADFIAPIAKTSAFNDQFHTIYEDFFSITEKIVTHALKHLPFDIDATRRDYLVYRIFLILSDAIDLKTTKKNITIKLICINDPLIETYLKQLLISQSDRPLVLYSSSTDADLATTYDILLSDVSFVEGKYQANNFYVYNIPPTKRDLQHIKQLIESVELS